MKAGARSAGVTRAPSQAAQLSCDMSNQPQQGEKQLSGFQAIFVSSLNLKWGIHTLQSVILFFQGPANPGVSRGQAGNSNGWDRLGCVYLTGLYFAC